MATTNVEKSGVPRYNTVVIVGAGMGGIAMAAKLQKQLNCTDFHIYEKADSTGGTWRQNNYPGCACDVPGAFYSFSFEPNYDIKRMNPTQKETKEYCDKVAAKYGVPQRATFKTRVYKASWQEEKRQWRVWARNWETDEEIVHDCKVLITAVGILDVPNDTFNVPGRETFKGKIMHTTGWDHSVELKGKNVVVVGNGCTAAQLVPALLDLGVANIYQFFRSRHFYIPMPVDRDAVYPENLRKLWKLLPFTLYAYRIAFFLYIEQSFLFFYNHKLGRWYRKKMTKESIEFMEKTAPKKYHELLRPDFDLGCKRRIVEGEYLKSLHDPRISLHQNSIASVTPTSIISASGEEIPADVIALATGFNTTDFLYGIELTGVNGVNVKDHWKRYGGAEAYNCSAMHEFPNFFMILGPNTAPGHTSALMYAENNADYAINVLRPLLTNAASRVEVKKPAEDKWVISVQSSLKNMVWNTGCNSWYNRGVDGWNSTTYPWTSFWYWYQSNFVNWGDWEVELTEAGRRRRRRRRVGRAVVGGVAIAGVAAVVLAVRRGKLGRRDLAAVWEELRKGEVGKAREVAEAVWAVGREVGEAVWTEGRRVVGV